MIHTVKIGDQVTYTMIGSVVTRVITADTLTAHRMLFAAGVPFTLVTNSTRKV